MTGKRTQEWNNGWELEEDFNSVKFDKMVHELQDKMAAEEKQKQIEKVRNNYL